ncbi:immunoglobulin superfamily containing leucine-rich repeat protein-like [Galendromus occidentalis]|uniref:Immunoglobulin superfamily containing leucine-rich repeat protein-like n=1 Tax=Galendromus occidentalis TaxID=34638 RepID=A0AAJ6VZ35_9ACAR|nr:immunoglobulin superfamily containing leucine-rich repeat protein-like [Galendromus occidentalis]
MRFSPKRRPWQPDHRLVRLLLLILLSKISIPVNCLAVDDVYDESINEMANATVVLGTFETDPPLPVTEAAAAAEDVDDCAPCLCKWSGGKQTADCAGAQLVEVPRGLRAETQVVNLTGNALTVLGSREFHSKGYSSLQRIFVSHCHLTQVAADTFYLLTNLVELDLSFNRLQSVPSQALSDCTSLRRLSLIHNPIETLHDDAFRGLSRLGTLELSHCQLHTVETLAFRGLRGLEFLRMAHNRLSRLQSAALTDQLPTQLYGVNLEENPWVCDCELRHLRQWMLDNNIPLSAPPKCQNPPRLQGISWSALSMDDLACAPELSSVPSSVKAVEMENATIRCEVDSEPPSSTDIAWSLNGRQIRNMSLMSFGRQLYVISEEESLGRVKTSVLTIVNVFIKDAGTYVCTGSNRAGKVTANVTLYVLPREEFGPLTAVEIVGVTVGFVLTCTVMLAAVYMVMQQYARYCEERAVSSSDDDVDRKETKSCNRKSDVAAAAAAATKSNYETVVAVNRRHVSVDLLDGAQAFTELGLTLCPSVKTCSKATPATTSSVLEFDTVLVEAIASELEEKIASRLIGNLALTNNRRDMLDEENVPPPAPRSANESGVAATNRQMAE